MIKNRFAYCLFLSCSLTFARTSKRNKTKISKPIYSNRIKTKAIIIRITSELVIHTPEVKWYVGKKNKQIKNAIKEIHGKEKLNRVTARICFCVNSENFNKRKEVRINSL